MKKSFIFQAEDKKLLISQLRAETWLKDMPAPSDGCGAVRPFFSYPCGGGSPSGFPLHRPITLDKTGRRTEWFRKSEAATEKA